MLNTLTAFLFVLLFSSAKGGGKTTSSFFSERKKTLGSLLVSHSATVCLSEVRNLVRIDRTHMYESGICKQKINKINNKSVLTLCDETYFFFLCQSSLDLRSSVVAVKNVRIHHWEWFSRYTVLRC